VALLTVPSTTSTLLEALGSNLSPMIVICAPPPNDRLETPET
jgi:hypothetical protein